MHLGGDLALFDPPAIFQFLSMHTLTGHLKLITVKDVASLYFDNGNLVYATMDTGRSKKIGDLLIEKGAITKEDLQTALQASKHRQGLSRIGEILIENGALDRKTLVQTIQEQMKEVVYQIIAWREGHFIYFNEVRPDPEEILLDVKIDYLLLEGSRRLDESVFASKLPSSLSII